MDYWFECIASALEDAGLTATDEQKKIMAAAVEVGHENIGQAFYEPPASDRIQDIERAWKAKLEAKEREITAYKNNAEEAVKVALKQHPSEHVSIGEYGEVLRHGGRTTRIQ